MQFARFGAYVAILFTFFVKREKCGAYGQKH